MSAVPKANITFEEYLSREKIAPHKSEFYRGEVFAMAGGSLRHNRIAANLLISLGGRLLGTRCLPCNSDQRIRIPANGLTTYPDASVYCGEAQVENDDCNAIVNPTVIFEVLSKSTESYDRGKKFDLYRALDSLREYILVSQEDPQVDRFVRQDDGSWVLTVIKGMDAQLQLSTLSCGVPLSEIYANVMFGPEVVVQQPIGVK